MNKILLVGGGGFIGKNLANFLVHLNFEVTIVGRFNDSELSLINNNIKVYKIPIINSFEFEELISNASTIVWLAHSLVPGIEIDSKEDFLNNILPVWNAYELSQKKILPTRFIYVSTGGAIYGNIYDNIPISETNQSNPISQYGKSKIQIEIGLQNIASKYNSECFILRPSNVYGPLQNMNKPQGIIGYTIYSIFQNTPLTLYNNGLQIRDFIHVDDLCYAISLIISNQKLEKKCNIFNISSSLPIRIIDLVKLIERISLKKIDLIHKPERLVDSNYAVLDNTKFKVKYNWDFKITLEEGIQALLNDFKKIKC
jgi:UDP-glucose 4-epimerase